MSVSRQELLSRIEFRGIDKIEECFDRARPAPAYSDITATGSCSRHRPCHKEASRGRNRTDIPPLRSQLFDRLFINMRQSMGGVCVPKKDILRYLVSFRSQNLMNLFGYIADQAPRYRNIHLWLPFLNHDTPVFTGAERIMRKMNNAVFYIDVERPERGKYIYTFKLMTDKPGEMPEFEITKKFFVMLEQTIRREPRFYLWSHNRWKRTREEFDKEFKIENGHVVRK